MRTILKWGIRLILVLVIAAAAVGFWKREEITRLMAVNTLFDEGRIVENFSNMDRAFLHKPVDRGTGPVSDLPYGAEMALPDGTEAWIDAHDVTGLVVLHQGEIVHESYHLGTAAEDRRISWSIAKSWLSLLLGQLLDEGVIDSLDAPVIDFAPDMARSAYADATLRHALMMRSGIAFDEDYLDPNSDINRMGRVIALGGTLDGFAASLTAQRDTPGESWQYTSIDTHVVGQVIRAATGQDIASLLSERLIQPMGLESEPYYLVDGEDVAFVLGGLNMMTRDYARLGLLVAQNGVWNDTQLVPADWIETSIVRSAGRPLDKIGYGYQWWIPVGAGPGEVTARGIYGQYVWIDRSRQVVIAVNAADRQFRESGRDQANVEIFRKIATSLESR